MKAGTFEAAFYATWMSAQELKWAFGAGAGPRFHNTRAATLIDRAGATAEPDAEDQIDRELLRIFRADPPAIFLFPRVFTMVVRRRLRSLSAPWRGNPSLFMDDLWLED